MSTQIPLKRDRSIRFHGTLPNSAGVTVHFLPVTAPGYTHRIMVQMIGENRWEQAGWLAVGYKPCGATAKFFLDKFLAKNIQEQPATV